MIPYLKPSSRQPAQARLRAHMRHVPRLISDLPRSFFALPPNKPLRRGRLSSPSPLPAHWRPSPLGLAAVSMSPFKTTRTGMNERSRVLRRSSDPTQRCTALSPSQPLPLGPLSPASSLSTHWRPSPLGLEAVSVTPFKITRRRPG